MLIVIDESTMRGMEGGRELLCELSCSALWSMIHILHDDMMMMMIQREMMMREGRELSHAWLLPSFVAGLSQASSVVDNS